MKGKVASRTGQIQIKRWIIPRVLTWFIYLFANYTDSDGENGGESGRITASTGLESLDLERGVCVFLLPPRELTLLVNWVDLGSKMSRSRLGALSIERSHTP